MAVGFGLVVVATLRALPSCLDVTPIIVEQADGRATSTKCVRCLESAEGCAELIADCRSDPENPECSGIYDCMVTRTCLDLPALDEKIRCGLPCAQEAGIVSTDHPIVTNYLLGLVLCGQQKCPVECDLTDAGVGF